MPPLLSLSSLQLDVVIDRARLLHRFQRGAFLQRVADFLRGRQVSNEAVARAVKDAQSEFRS